MINSYTLRFWLLGLIYLISCTINAQQINLDTAFYKKNVISESELWVDTSGDATIEDIIRSKPQFLSPFKANQNLPYPNVYWIKFQVKANSHFSGLLVVPGDSTHDYVHQRVDNLQVFVINTDGEIVQREMTGALVPRSQKKIIENTLIAAVPLHLKSGEEYHIYCRIQQLRIPNMINLNLELRHELIGVPRIDYSWRVAILGPWGMFLIIGIYVLTFFFYTKDRSFLYFGLFCLFYSHNLISIEPDGGFSNLISEYPKLKIPLFNASLFSIPFLLLFGLEFVQIKRKYKFWYRYFLFALISITLALIYHLVRSFWPPYEVIQKGLFVTLLFLIPVSLRFIFSKDRLAKIYGIGMACFFIANVVGALLLGSDKSWTPIIWMTGQFILLMIFALALAYRFVEGERQKLSLEKERDINRTKNRFFSNISHELKTPLSLIMGPVLNVNQSIEDDHKEFDSTVSFPREHVEMIKRNGLRLQQLINQILDLSKLEAGSSKLQLKQGKIIDFIRSRVAEFSDVANSKRIEMLTQYSADNSLAVFDPEALEKILFNLLSNACKFTDPKGQIRFLASVDEKILKIKISDNGKGMSQEEISKVFDRFYQADSSQKEGSGIGMSLVKELVKLSNGKIDIVSQLGEGTDISIEIPISLPSTSDDLAVGQIDIDKYQPISTSIPAVVDESDFNESLEKELPLILLCEDNSDLQHFLKDILGGEFNVIFANNGLEGKEMALEMMPELVICDVLMPKMNGIELGHYLKNEEKTSHIPLLYLSAKSDGEDVIEGLSTGAEDYITKPFDPNELRLKVRNQLKQQKLLREKFSKNRWKILNDTSDTLDERFLKSVFQTIQDNLSNELFSVEDLGRAVGYSRSQLFRKLKAITGKSPVTLIREQRLFHARNLIENKMATVTEAAYLVGYNSSSHFSQSFKKEFGVSPSDLGRGN